MKKLDLKEINLNDLKTFYYVGKLRNYSKVAEELLVSQPTISNSVRSLEEYFDTILVIRFNKGVTLTQDGIELFNLVSNILTSINENADLEDSKTVNIGIPSYLGRYFISKIYTKEIFKEFNVNIVCNSTNELIRMLETGEIDLIIDDDIGYLTNNNIITKDLIEVDSCFAGNKDYISLTEQENNISDLINYDLLLPNEKNKQRKILNNEFKELINYKSKLSFNSSEMMATMAKAGAGIGYFTRISIMDDLYEKKLFEIPTNMSLPSTKIQISYKKVCSSSTKKIIELLMDYINKINVTKNKVLRVELSNKNNDLGYKDLFFLIKVVFKYYYLFKLHFEILDEIDFEKFNNLLISLSNFRMRKSVTIDYKYLDLLKNSFDQLTKINVILNNLDDINKLDLLKEYKDNININFDLVEDNKINKDNIDKYIELCSKYNFNLKIVKPFNLNVDIEELKKYVLEKGFNFKEQFFKKIIYSKNIDIIFKFSGCECCLNGNDCLLKNNIKFSMNGNLSTCRYPEPNTNIVEELKSNNQYLLEDKIDRILFNQGIKCYKNK